MPYKTILMDPPWSYPGPGWFGGAERHYPTMSMAEIKALDVPALADEDAVMWLWVTNPFMTAGFELLRHWGFTYKSMVTWVKIAKSAPIRPRIGNGYWLRGATEHLLLGVRGRVKPLVRDQATWFMASVEEHSRKPPASYAIIERYYHGPYLEMFARTKRPGWHAWGNEVESDLTVEAT